MNRATPAGRTRGITWQQLCAHAASLPGVEQGSCYGTPALYVRKRFLARLKEDGETVAINAVELLEQAWRRAAPKRLVLAYASSRGARRHRPTRG